MHIEDPVRAGDNFDGRHFRLPLLKYLRRETCGVRKRPSGDAIFDADTWGLSHPANSSTR
jgi:hypothetical protein